MFIQYFRYTCSVTKRDSIFVLLARGYIYLLMIARGSLYTPIIISVAIFIRYIPLAFSSTSTTVTSLPQPPYSVEGFVGWPAPYFLIIGLIISLIEWFCRDIWHLTLKRKLLILTIGLTSGYLITVFALVMSAPITNSQIIAFIVPFYGFTIFSLLLNSITWRVLQTTDDILRRNP